VQLLQLDKANITLKFTRNQLFPKLDAFGEWGLTAYDDNLYGLRGGGSMSTAIDDFGDRTGAAASLRAQA